MKILSSNNQESLICVLPNGVTVEVTLLSLCGEEHAVEHDVNQVMKVIKSLPSRFTTSLKVS